MKYRGLRKIENFESVKIIISKKFRNFCKICSIFEIFLRKMDFSGKKNLAIVEKWVNFLYPESLENFKLRYHQGLKELKKTN